jgi:hypothetical protein
MTNFHKFSPFNFIAAFPSFKNTAVYFESEEVAAAELVDEPVVTDTDPSLNFELPAIPRQTSITKPKPIHFLFFSDDIRNSPLIFKTSHKKQVACPLLFQK